MESDDAKNPSAEHRDTPRPGRTPKSSRQRIRETAGDFADQQLEALQKRVAQMEKPTACVDTEAQKKIDALETEAQQLRSELSKLREQATAAADEKKVARPDYRKMKCAICGRIGHIATTCRQKNRPPEKQRLPLADRHCYYCLEKGHFIINCPERPSRTATSNADFQSKTGHTANSRGIDTSLTKEAYIELELGGKIYRCLLDTGGDVTLLPASIVYRQQPNVVQSTERRFQSLAKRPLTPSLVVRRSSSPTWLLHTSMNFFLALRGCENRMQLGSSAVESC